MQKHTCSWVWVGSGCLKDCNKSRSEISYASLFLRRLVQAYTLQAEEPAWKSEILKTGAIWILTAVHGYSSHAPITLLSPELFAAETGARLPPGFAHQRRSDNRAALAGCHGWPEPRAGADRVFSRCGRGAAGAAAAALTQRAGKGNALPLRNKPRQGCHSPRGKGHWQHD